MNPQVLLSTLKICIFHQNTEHFNAFPNKGLFMQDLATLLPVIAVFLTFLIGFIANRTTLCAVRAAREIVIEKKAWLLVSFIQIIGWAMLVFILLEQLPGLSIAYQHRYPFSHLTLVGGFLFGIGAALNNGCALHTLVRLGRGDLRMFISLSGLVGGAYLCNAYMLPHVSEAPPLLPQFSFVNVYGSQYLTYTAILALITGLFWLMKNIRLKTLWKTLTVSRYSLSGGAALIGIFNGVLFCFAGNWTYTYHIVSHTTGDSSQISILAVGMTLSLFAGLTFSAWQSDGFKLIYRPQSNWLRYFLAGILMGIGIIFIPGGNDVLLLNGIPSLSPHALPAYLSIIAGAACLIFIRTKIPTRPLV